jgi:serine/threonine-protein kinase
VALLAVLLSVYQWLELVEVRSGGDAPLCTLSANLDCAAVWNSAFSQQVHRLTKLPVVGWGLAWGLVVLALAVALLYIMKKQPATAPDTLLWALRLTTATGVLVVLALLVYSISIGLFCPTCILFYVLVAAAAYLTFRQPASTSPPLADAALLSAGLLLVVFAPLLYFGLHTPRENILTTPISSVTDGALPQPVVHSATPLEQFLNSLPPRLQEATGDALAMYRAAQPVNKPLDPRRLTYGSASAPVHLIEWTDIRCPHCKNMEAHLDEIRRISPDGSWSQETRHYPLDNECNPNIERSGGGISCLAARLEICLIGSPEFSRVRSKLFEEQENLTKERIWEIASQDSERRKTLEACVDSPATAATLQEDIAYAEQHGITGTPLVVINARKAPALPAFMFALIMAQGRADDPGFAVLPKPRSPTDF